jgi:glucokinase
VTLTNLNWNLDERSLAAELNIPKVALVNDLVAHAEGIEMLGPEQLIELNAGEPVPRGNRAIIAAGTGLGEAGLVFDPHVHGYRAFASEGGHADFAPRGEQEIALLRYVEKIKQVATWERVLSGPGLSNIYNFLTTPEQLGPAAALTKPDPTPGEISAAALDGTNRAAAAALEMFVKLYGSEAGNLALKLLASGGVYLGGGIAPRIVAKLKSRDFLNAFQLKGPAKLRPLMQRIPIHVINVDTNALLGAANVARRL